MLRLLANVITTFQWPTAHAPERPGDEVQNQIRRCPGILYAANDGHDL
jgi:hypothetical protein